jgi:hypothetical protein
MNRILVIILLPIALVLASCAREPLKQAGLQGEGTLGAVRGLTGAYEHRDLEGFMERLSPSFPERNAFRHDIENVFAAYQNIRFTVQTRKMLFTVEHKGNIRATFTWEGEWRTTGGRIVKDGGRVTFVLDAGTYKLLAIDGKVPFVPTTAPVPARQ